jgi:two-component sensor histidine kinase
LCVLDHRPRTLSDLQQRLLLLLAEQVMTQIRLTREAETARALLIEVDHRVKNSLSLVTSLLGLQARQAADPALVEGLERARERVVAIANVHNLLHETGSVTDVDLSIFIGRLVASLAATAPPGVSVTAAVPPVMIGAAQVVTLGIILNELVTNALRHAFSGGRAGSVEVSGSVDGPTMTLTVVDDGEGLPVGFDAARGNGLGMRLTTALASQIGDGLVWSSANGAAFSFDFRLTSAEDAAAEERSRA